MKRYPPGVSGCENQIIGDEEWEKFHEKIDDDCVGMALNPEDAQKIWELGKAEWAKTQA